MDTLTHALSGAILARATATPEQRLSVRRRVAVGFLAGAFPDSDFVIRFFTDPITYFNLHRGVTHSLILMPLWALLLAWAFAFLWRERRQWRDYYGVAILALTIHISGDIITAYGTKILAPFSDWKAAYPTTFIIDLWFTGIIALGLMASLIWRRSRLPAVTGLVVLAGYVGFQSLLLQQATNIGREYVAALNLNQATVQALPQPLSPFNWKLIVSNGERYHIANINLIRKDRPEPPAADAGFFTRVDAAYQPLANIQWHEVEKYGHDIQTNGLAREMWQHPKLAAFRAFAEFPALANIEQREEGQCLWYEDLRFVLKNIRSPFRFGLCGNGGNEWGLYRLNGPDITPVM